MTEHRDFRVHDVTLVDEHEPPAPTRGQPAAQLTVLGGMQLGRVFPLSEPTTTIGRDFGLRVTIRHASVSREHARIRALPGGDYEIEDLGSRNGTRVDGERLRGRRLLRSGDRIQVGPRVLLQFLVVDQLERRLQEAERLEAIGRLSAAVNHDFNNLLTVVACGVSHLSTLDPDTPLAAQEVRECLEEIESATHAAADLTSRLALFVASKESTAHEPVDISALCREVGRLTRRIVPGSIRVECAIEPGLLVDGCRAQIHQLLMNPCINARDAMPQGGVLRIRAKPATYVDVAELPELEVGRYVLISISDTGVGIPESIRSQVFAPFFTTKGAGAGTGLGLATVARVARQHGGGVSIASDLGSGTTLRILLPASAREQDTATRYDTLDGLETPQEREGARVLLVDDDSAIVRAFARVLARDGHRVIGAHDGRQALEHFASGARPHAVVLDVEMPIMDGPACYERLRAIDPHVPVFFVSGRADPEVERQLLDAGARGYFHKPLDIGLVSASIRAAVGRSCGPKRAPKPKPTRQRLPSS